MDELGQTDFEERYLMTTVLLIGWGVLIFASYRFGVVLLEKSGLL